MVEVVLLVKKPIIVIEHLEPCLSPWILSEYRFVSKLFGKNRLIFTNVKNSKSQEVLLKLGNVYSGRFIDIFRDITKKSIVLDPQAKLPLRRAEVLRADAIIIGGIMGDHPPRGRTYKFITKEAVKAGALARNLGSEQLTIAGAAYVIKIIEEGFELNDIKIMKGLRIELELSRGIKLELYLPYAFPLRNGKPVVPEDYIDTIIRKSTVFEQYLLSESIECYPGKESNGNIH